MCIRDSVYAVPNNKTQPQIRHWDNATLQTFAKFGVGADLISNQAYLNSHNQKGQSDWKADSDNT